MFSNFLTGTNYLLRGFGYLNKRGLRRFIWIPTLISFLVYVLLLTFFCYQFGNLMDWLLPDANAVDNWPDWIRWAGAAALFVIRLVLWVVFFIAYALSMFYTFTIFANLIGSPFNGILSSKVELLSTGQPLPDEPLSLKMITAEASHAIKHEFVKIIYFLLFAIPLLILFIIPVINIVASFVWIIFSAWMAALQYIDYPADNRKTGFRQMRRTITPKRAVCFGFGAATMVMMAIPVVNFFTMPVAVIGATLLWVEQFPEQDGSVKIEDNSD